MGRLIPSRGSDMTCGDGFVCVHFAWLQFRNVNKSDEEIAVLRARIVLCKFRCSSAFVACTCRFLNVGRPLFMWLVFLVVFLYGNGIIRNAYWLKLYVLKRSLPYRWN